VVAIHTLFQYKMSLKTRSCWGVNILMDDAEKSSLESIGRLVAAREEIRFEAEDRQQFYGWVEQVLAGRQSAQPGKAARGLVRRCIEAEPDAGHSADRALHLHRAGAGKGPSCPSCKHTVDGSATGTREVFMRVF